MKWDWKLIIFRFEIFTYTSFEGRFLHKKILKDDNACSVFWSLPSLPFFYNSVILQNHFLLYCYELLRPLIHATWSSAFIYLRVNCFLKEIFTLFNSRGTGEISDALMGLLLAVQLNTLLMSNCVHS